MIGRCLGGVLCVALFVSGCETRQPATTTFVLDGQDDWRLPAASHEEQGADDEDRRLLDGLVAHHLQPESSARRAPIAVVWNQLTTELGLNAGLPPPLLARAYSLTQVAIFDALVAAHDERRGELSDAAVAAGAASTVLFDLFPLDSLRIKEVSGSQLDASPAARRAFCLGRHVGKLLLQHARQDGSARVFSGERPRTAGTWSGAVPLLPLAGTWKTWIIESGAEFAPQAPYAPGSAEDMRELEAVYTAALTRTAAQIAAVHKWADLPPPTVWNEYLNARLTREGWSALRAAKASAYLNTAMFDGFVSCWNAKYRYWTLRPYMRLADRDPKFATVVTTPPFPSYTSGHSTISGAAAVVMGALFPREKQFFAAEAQEAALSRLWAGIHFSHDNEEGLRIGQSIGARAVQRMQRDGM